MPDSLVVAVAATLLFVPMFILIIGWRAYYAVTSRISEIVTELVTAGMYIVSVCFAIYMCLLSKQQHSTWWDMNYQHHWG